MFDTAACLPYCSSAWQCHAGEEGPLFRGGQAPSHTTGFLQESEECCQFAKQVSGHSAIRVKNTFIQAFLVDDDSDDEDGVPMVAVKSCPPVRMRASSSISTSAEDSSSDSSPTARWLVVGPMGAEHQAELCQGEAAQEVRRPQITPPELRKPEASVGSSLHGTGQCKPCAWFWRPQGCDNGGDCRHCHLCLPGVLKERRKARAAAARKSCRGSTADVLRSTQDVHEEPQMLQ